MQFARVWAIELSELDAMNRSEASAIKAVLTRRFDRLRPPFGRRVREYPRSCIFLGTTNSSLYLKDETGGRRFWPIACGVIDLAGLREVRDQLMAEADMLYGKGVAWHIVSAKIQTTAQDEQATRYTGDPWTEAALQFVDLMASTTIPDILETCLCLPIDRHDQPAMNRVARILRANGWERFQKRDGEIRTWAYRKVGGTKANAGVSA
jgi:predicted P-loop ATPase